MNHDQLKYLLLVIITLASAFVLSTITRRIMRFYIKKSVLRIKANPTQFSFIKNSVSFVIYTVAIVIIFFKIPALNSIGKAIFAGAGILAAIIGFAAQKTFSNVISGVFILIFKPFSVGDTIETGTGHRGIVEEITLSHIVLRDFENRRIVVPNSVISDETIVNSSLLDEKIKKHIEFSIGYNSDTETAIRIIREEAERHPLSLDQRTTEEMDSGCPKVRVRLIALGDYSQTLRAYVWAANNDEAFDIKCDLLRSVKRRFDEEGIEIPYPYQNVIVKSENGITGQTGPQ
ncbi:MAG: mechanosensitive ion channel family protein [Bacteroidota bacterium]